ncbi:hypothetical protein [Nitrosomonas marina]|uniref:Morphogenetic protein n=1 Tax=Nitrosomonas marina TaxID=917 RepID=A0A1H8IGV8_9PROT|nr:hypothetical protein [Nitrosomonas marina]SEN68090.1 hypothetical protein SAMN05216325_13311 [Nitrosomonas marina]
MKEKPIIYSDPMVVATLEGRKTQTRRIVKRLAKYGKIIGFDRADTKGYACQFRDKRGRLHNLTYEELLKACPYGTVGEKLWVRESTIEDYIDDKPLARYSADMAWSDIKWWYSRPSCPSIHMPRWASRITLEITSLRVERVQDISDDDVGREGLAVFGGGDVDSSGQWHRLYFDPRPDHDNEGIFAKEAYKNLWGMIHGKNEWDKNPWVWVIGVKRI